jgi:hypothetical protein
MADDTAARGEGTREHGPKRHVVEERATAAHLMRLAIIMPSAFNQPSISTQSDGESLRRAPRRPRATWQSVALSGTR